MEQRPLGTTGRTVSAVGLGTVTFGREIDEDTSFKVMDHAFEKGINFFDTAEGYASGGSESIVGRWMRQRGVRDDIVLCTKVGSGGGADNVAGALGRSLERLDTGHVDIYKMHGPDPDTPIAETLAAMTAQVDAGKVKAIGCSNYSADQLREALDASAAGGHRRFEVLQPPYSLAHRDAEEELFPLCRREQIGVTSFSPLGAGFLAGKYTADRATIPPGSRFDVIPGHIDIYFSDRNFQIVELLRAKAEELGMPMVSLAMAYAVTQPDITSVLVGARTTAHIDNALAAYESGLDPELRAEMSAWGR